MLTALLTTLGPAAAAAYAAKKIIKKKQKQQQQEEPESFEENWMQYLPEDFNVETLKETTPAPTQTSTSTTNKKRKKKKTVMGGNMNINPDILNFLVRQKREKAGKKKLKGSGKRIRRAYF